jgi:hypothetical protein
MFAARELREIGYQYIPGPSGNPSDLVLRQTADPAKGFEWRGQQNYDALGDAVLSYVEAQLSVLCGLEALPLPKGGASAYSAVYATPGFREHAGPLLLLVCGSSPGGAAGVWGRSLCINASLLEGAMFDYIFRAKALGWAVIVANPHVKEVCATPIEGSECPHLHVKTLWKAYIEPAPCSCVLVVAHSYGAPVMIHLLKCEPVARERIKALVMTDGGVFHGELCQEAVPTAEQVSASGNPEKMEKLRAEMASCAGMVPEAFKPPSTEVLACLAAVGRNFASSALPPGTVLAADPSKQAVATVSAGHESHPSTTHAATEEVFAFLRLGPDGGTAAANATVREGAAAHSK